MMYSDSSRRGVPFAKDPVVAKYRGRYFMYYSLPAAEDGSHPWGIGIAQSDDLTHWRKTGELNAAPEWEIEKNGICAPGAIVRNDTLHLFYQTYNNGAADAICHAWSVDGERFVRDATNPVFHSSAPWNCGRAIDAEVAYFKGHYYLYYATRDQAFRIQQIGVARTDGDSGFARDSWTELGDGPALRPELPWEGDCIEAPSVIERGGRLYMFYAGNYNNHPQQIGVAASDDGMHWQRLGDSPLLANGKAGEWNSSESGHPAIFADRGATWLFFQGNNDNGRTWHLSATPIVWRGGIPALGAAAKIPRHDRR